MSSNIKKQIANELSEALDEKDLKIFKELVKSSLRYEYDLNTLYGPEVGYKTLLHLALEEEDGYPFAEELLMNGASASYYNSRAGSAPIHAAAGSAFASDIIKLLLKNASNKADVNVPNRDGLTAFHLLLGKLLDLTSLENLSVYQRGPNPLNDDQLEQEIIHCFEALQLIAEQSEFRIDFENGVGGLKTNKTNIITIKKLSSMTPLQILCSFQTWNAKNVPDSVHNCLEKLVATLLDKGINPNGTAARGALPGTVPGSTPSVLLAATRGYFKVVEVFKRYYNTNFLLENKFQQTILHVVLKAGYYNKIVVHGDECGFVNIKTIHALFSDNNLIIQQQMRSIINRRDSYGNTALHYARQYPDQSIVKFLLSNGAKIDVNQQRVVNIHPRTLEEYFYESCITPLGDDIDDEDFRIRINFRLFEKPAYGANDDMELTKDKANAWTVESEKKKAQKVTPSTGKVDTRRLEYFSDVDSLRYLLKHPLMTSFLELELNSLKIRYFLEFVLYLAFVIVLFMHLGNRYGFLEVQLTEDGGYLFEIDGFGIVTFYVLILFIFVLILILRETYQIIKQKKRYFTAIENYIEWFVIGLATVSIIPRSNFKGLGATIDEEAQRHIAALTLLIAFMQLYLLLVRVVPNTPIPVYINMFITVMKTYALILMSYLAFILSFAYSFFLVFSDREKSLKMTRMAGNATQNAAAAGEDNDRIFGNFGFAVVKTIVMFIGEMDYNDLEFSHWLGYVIFVLFTFLLIIVLMNILNGLAVSDISKIREEVDTYYHISIVETLASTSFVSLLVEEVTIFPNMRPEHPKILGIPVPGFKVYHARGGKEGDEKPKIRVTFSENTVKAAKELVALKQQQNQAHGSKVTLEQLENEILDMKRDASQIKSKLNHLDDNVKTILEIMASRQPVVERI